MSVYALYDLLPEQIVALMEPVDPKAGGIQGLTKRLQDSLVGTTLHVSARDFFTLVRWAPKYLIDADCKLLEGGRQKPIPRKLREDAVDYATGLGAWLEPPKDSA